jgi:hypothetical protein
LFLLATTVLVVLPVVGGRPANIAAAASDPVLVAAGDISCGPENPDYNNGNGENNACQMKATKNEIANIAPQYLLPMGDTQYDEAASQGTEAPLADYQTSYDAIWGTLASTQGGPVPNQNIHPIPGGHEYGDVDDSGNPPLANASHYFTNFGPAGLDELPPGVNSPNNDWYSFNIPVNGGTWHVVSLDSECNAIGGCNSGSPEERFFANDLAANAGVCTIVEWHEPRWSVGPFGNVSAYTAFWDDAVAAHVVMVLGGHDHDYEHFGPMDANGNPVANGTSEFIVGTGGDSLDSQSGTSPALLASDFNDFGVLKLTLHSTGADYVFQTVAGTTKDSGTLGCTSSRAPTITAVGSLINKSGTAVTTLAVAPQDVGDLLTLAVKVSSTSITAAAISGGGVSTWTRAEGPYTGYGGHDLEIWTGTVSTTGSSTITVSYSGAVTSLTIGLAAQEFTASSGSGTVWALDTGGAISNASSTTATFPKLTPGGTGELYVGYDAVAETGSAGTTAGFSYATTSDADVAAFDTNVSSAVQPTATQSPAGLSGGVAVLVTAS